MVWSYRDMGVAVSLTIKEYRKATKYGSMRAKSYIEDGYGTPRGGKGLDTVHKEGAVGEMMVCTHYGVEFDERVIDGGDEGSDIRLDGERVDVKATTESVPYLRARKSKVEEAEVDRYMLVKLEPEYGGVASKGFIIGHISSEWLKENITPKRAPRDILNYNLSWDRLNEI